MVLKQGASPLHSGSLRAQRGRAFAREEDREGKGSKLPKDLPCLTRTSAHSPQPSGGRTTASTSLQRFLFRMEATWPVHRTTREAAAWSTHRGLLHPSTPIPAGVLGNRVFHEQSGERRPNIRLYFFGESFPLRIAHTPVPPIPRVAQRRMLRGAMRRRQTRVTTSRGRGNSHLPTPNRVRKHRAGAGTTRSSKGEEHPGPKT